MAQRHVRATPRYDVYGISCNRVSAVYSVLPAESAPDPEQLNRHQSGARVLVFDVTELTEGDDVRCTVCQEDLQAGEDMKITSCGHRFHTVCILRALQHGTACPNYKGEIS